MNNVYSKVFTKSIFNQFIIHLKKFRRKRNTVRNESLHHDMFSYLF